MYKGNSVAENLPRDKMPGLSFQRWMFSGEQEQDLIVKMFQGVRTRYIKPKAID